MLTVEFHSKPSEEQFGYQAEFAMANENALINTIKDIGPVGNPASLC